MAGPFFDGAFFDGGFFAPLIPPGTAGGGRIIHGGPAYYPKLQKQKQRLEAKIRSIQKRIDKKELEAKALQTKLDLEFIEALRRQLVALWNQLADLELELSRLKSMREKAEAEEIAEVWESYLMSRSLH